MVYYLNNNVSLLFNKSGTMNICTTRVGPLSFRVPKHRLELSAVHPQVMGPKTWNKLPIELRVAPSIPIFKKKIPKISINYIVF